MGQCKTVYVVDWLTDGRSQVDIKRLWTHETFDNTRVHTFAQWWDDCDLNPCDDFASHTESMIAEAKNIIENGYSMKKRRKTSSKSAECQTCDAFSNDPNDPEIVGCIKGTSSGSKTTCQSNQQCLTYFMVNNMNTPSTFYQVRRDCRESKFLAVQSSHYLHIYLRFFTKKQCLVNFMYF